MEIMRFPIVLVTIACILRQNHYTLAETTQTITPAYGFTQTQYTQDSSSKNPKETTSTITIFNGAWNPAKDDTTPDTPETTISASKTTTNENESTTT
eukprot:gene4415-8534_t